MRHKIVYFLFFILLFGCNSSKDNPKPDDNVKSISLVVANNGVFAPGSKVVFVVKDDKNKELTSNVKVFVDGKAISGFTHVFEKNGKYETYAKYGKLTSNKVTITIEEPTLKNITVSRLGSKKVAVNDVVNFVVKTNLGQNVSLHSEIYVAGKKISGTKHVFTKEGTYEVYAKYQKFTSEKIRVHVGKGGSHIAKVLVHDFTGTWCGFCAPIMYNIKGMHKKIPNNFISIAIHGNSAKNGEDPFAYPKFKEFGVKDFPTLWYNNEPMHLDEVQIVDLSKKKKEVGLAVHYDLKNNKATVKVHYDVEPLKNSKLVVYLLEDKLIADQANYDNNDPQSPAYKKGNPIPNAEHNSVLRTTLTKLLGDKIDNSKVKNNIYTAEFDLTSKKGNVKEIKNTKIVAFVVDVDDKNRAVNAQEAKANENKGFE